RYLSIYRSADYMPIYRGHIARSSCIFYWVIVSWLTYPAWCCRPPGFLLNALDQACMIGGPSNVAGWLALLQKKSSWQERPSFSAIKRSDLVDSGRAVPRLLPTRSARYQKRVQRYALPHGCLGSG